MDYNVLRSRLQNLAWENKDKKFIIYPMGEYGTVVKGILNGQMGIMESYIIDNKLCNKCDWIHPVSFLEKLCCENYLVLIACEHACYSREIKESLKPYNVDYYDLLYLEEGAYEEILSENYSKRVCHDKVWIEKQVCECLNSGKPFACGRLGHTECVIAYEYCKMKLGISDSFSDRFSKFLLTTSGFFSSPGKEKSDIGRYAEMTLDAIGGYGHTFSVGDRGGAVPAKKLCRQGIRVCTERYHTYTVA